MAFWLSSPDIGERQSGHAWCMHGTSKTIVCDLWKLVSTTIELSRATAAFRSSTRRLQPLKHILGGLRLHGECQNLGGFVPLLARDVGARRSLIRDSWFDSAERALSNQLSPACRGRTAEHRAVQEHVVEHGLVVAQDVCLLRRCGRGGRWRGCRRG